MMDAKKHYQIRIDNQLYEGSADLQEAEHLYDTVDETCLENCDEKEKTLVELPEERVIKSNIIKFHRR